jgi:hypothetical protein
MKMDLSIVQPSDGRPWRYSDDVEEREIKIVQIFAEPNFIDVRVEEGEFFLEIHWYVWGV